MFLYNLNCAEGEEMLMDLEMRTLFRQSPSKKQIETPIETDPSRSVFIKERLKILFEAPTFERLMALVKESGLGYETFKCLWLKYPGQQIRYHQRLAAMKEICQFIAGEADMQKPNRLLGLTEYEGRWLFGELDPNENSWVSHENKPYSYSFSLNVRTSRAIANVAVGHDRSKKIIDPCCGVGTVVLEVLTIGGNMRGNELNPKVAEKARLNLKAFGYENVIETGDIQDIEESFDTAIVDLPYGHFNTISPKIQQMIISEAGRIAKRVILVTQVDMPAQLEAAGLKMIEQCQVRKSSFTRYITICESGHMPIKQEV